MFQTFHCEFIFIWFDTDKLIEMAQQFAEKSDGRARRQSNDRDRRQIFELGHFIAKSIFQKIIIRINIIFKSVRKQIRRVNCLMFWINAVEVADQMKSLIFIQIYNYFCEHFELLKTNKLDNGLCQTIRIFMKRW